MNGEKPEIAVALPNELTYHDGDNGVVGVMAAGGDLKISLSENFANSLKWVISRQDPIFELHDESKKAVDSQNQVRIFRFLVKSGVGTVSFFYLNPWTDSPAVNNASFTVNAQ